MAGEEKKNRSSVSLFLFLLAVLIVLGTTLDTSVEHGLAFVRRSSLQRCIGHLVVSTAPALPVHHRPNRLISFVVLLRFVVLFLGQFFWVELYPGRWAESVKRFDCNFLTASVAGQLGWIGHLSREGKYRATIGTEFKVRNVSAFACHLHSLSCIVELFDCWPDSNRVRGWAVNAAV